MGKKEAPIWSNKRFVTLCSGQLISTLGTSVSALALPLLVLALTHSPSQAGYISAVETLPFLFFGLPAGAFIDRWNKKTVMVICDVVRFFTFMSIPLAFFFRDLTLMQLYIVAFVQGVMFVFFNIAQLAVLPEIVSQSDLPHAASVNEGANEIGQIAGPGLSGILIGLAKSTIAGAALAYVIDSISYGVSVVSLLFIPLSSRKLEIKIKRSLFVEVKDGISLFWNMKTLRAIGIIAFIYNVFGAAINLALIILMKNYIHTSTQLIGLVLSIGGIGGVVGSVLAPFIRKHVKTGHIILFTIIGETISLVIFALAPTVLLIILGMILESPLSPVYGVAVLSYRMGVVAPEMHGRTTSILRIIIYFANSLGLSMSGFLIVS